MIRVFSHGIRRIPHLEVLLREPVAGPLARGSVRAVAGWGLKPSARRARAYAARHELPYFALEDGFLRSVLPGPHDPPLALVLDDLGTYYDAERPSRLEHLIVQLLSQAETARARTLADTWRRERLSKYNHLREYEGVLPDDYVLVVDQTFGDASVHYGQATPESFEHMLEAALRDNPSSTVVVKVHPDAVAKRRRGYFNVAKLASMDRVQVLGEHAHPPRLIECARAVYTVTSQMGFEGLLWGKPVYTFGMPFYAGWGLTHDTLPATNRRGEATLEQLVHAALIAYPRYVHPETGQICEVEAIVSHLALQRRMRARFPRKLYAAGFSPYKRPLVRRFCWGSEVEFVRHPGRAPEDSPLVVWGQQPVSRRGPTIRLEDGFLRSVGLGADLIRPISWVMDEQGIYYDATSPSSLEHILETAEFGDALLDRARALRQRILRAKLTKYNVGHASWQPGVDVRRGERPVVLVPGQVEGDDSIAFGSPAIRLNVDLLRTVRAERPDAWLVYKPHPDVVAGLRSRGSGEEDAGRYCDEVVTDAPMGEVLDRVDEVCTLTSLAGFEALLRGKRVTCFGQPFYAGWGVTCDRSTLHRRRRRLSIDELTAGALILYPTYVSRTTRRFTGPERALEELLEWRLQRSARLPVWRRALRWGLRLRAG